MLTIPRKSYDDFTHWQKVQPYLPERLQLTPGREPAEEWWPWRGAEIHLDRYAAPSARHTVIVLHGGGGCGRLVAPFGRMLYDHGYEAVMPDLPGYGLSKTTPDMFSYDCWVDCVVDLVSAEIERGARSVALLGMSVGGYLAYLAAAKGRRAAGVIATTLADPRLPIVQDQFAKSPRLNRFLGPWLPSIANVFGDFRLPIKWFANMEGITNQPGLIELLCDDPLGGGNRVPLRFLRSLMSIDPAIEPRDFDLCPVLLAQPAADRWTTIEASRPVFDQTKGPKEFVWLENCGHFPIEEPGVTCLERAAVDFLARLA